MADNNKDLNKEKDSPASDLKVEFKPSGEKTGPFVVKKTADQIKIEGTQPTQSSLDINANLGSFGADATPSPVTSLSTDKVSTLEKIHEKNDELPVQDSKNAKIDFEKFERRKSVKVKSKFGIKFDGWLRQPKTLLRVWLVALGTIVVLWAAQICYLVFVTHILKSTESSPDKLYHSVGVVGNIFSYISIGLPVIPFLFLLTTAIIGINGMLSSRMFHYFLWTSIILAFICFLVSTGCSGFYMGEYYAFVQPYTS